MKQRSEVRQTKWLLAAALVAASAGTVSGGETRLAAEPLLERLRTEAVAEWRAMAAKWGQAGFEYTVVETERDGRQSRQRTKHVHGRLQGECFLITERFLATEEVSVYGRNDRYEFALDRRGDTPWTVSWQSSRRDEETPAGSAHAYLAGMLQLPWCISATPLERLVRHGRFSIQDARQQDDGRVEITFTVARAGGERDDLQGLTGGSFVLDSSRRWAVLQYRAKYGQAMSSAVTLEYGRAGPPELRRLRFALRTGPERSSQFAIDVAKYDWRAAESAEYTLSAFGLPEYQDPTGRGRWLRLVNIGVVFFLLGLIVWRRSQGKVR